MSTSDTYDQSVLTQALDQGTKRQQNNQVLCPGSKTKDTCCSDLWRGLGNNQTRKTLTSTQRGNAYIRSGQTARHGCSTKRRYDTGVLENDIKHVYNARKLKSRGARCMILLTRCTAHSTPLPPALFSLPQPPAGVAIAYSSNDARPCRSTGSVSIPAATAIPVCIAAPIHAHDIGYAFSLLRLARVKPTYRRLQLCATCLFMQSPPGVYD